MIATNSIQLLDWDSNFFGKKIGRITVKDESEFDLIKLKHQLSVESYDLVYIFSEELLPTYFEQPINTKVGFGMQISKNAIPRFSDNIKIYTSQEITPILKDLAYQAGHFSRFYLDVNFETTSFYQLYDKWLANSLGEDVLIITYLDNNQVAGMVTLETKADKNLIGLIGVDKHTRGKGIGKHLMNACIYYSQVQQKDYLEVYTQEENVNAYKFYESCGFNLISRRYIYHYWK